MSETAHKVADDVGVPQTGAQSVIGRVADFTMEKARFHLLLFGVLGGCQPPGAFFALKRCRNLSVAVARGAFALRL